MIFLRDLFSLFAKKSKSKLHILAVEFYFIIKSESSFCNLRFYNYFYNW